MIDQALERKLNDCRSLLKLWGLFQQYFEAAIKGDGINPENEKKFLDLKSRIAMLHDTFVDTVEEGAQAAVAQGMLDNVIRSITLRHINRLASADIRKMQIEWHESYLLLNEAIGSLEEKQLEISKVTASQWQAMQTKKAISRYTSMVYNSNMVRGLSILGVVVVLLVVLPMMGVFSYGGLRDVGPLRKPVFWLIENIVRPYIVKVNWRTVEEAKEFGWSGDPTQTFGDYVMKSPKGLPQSADRLPAWFSALSAGQLTDLSGVQPLTKASPASFDEYEVAGSRPLRMFYLILGSTQEAEDAVQKFRTWMTTMPTGIQEALTNQIDIDNDWNMVILAIGTSPDDRRSMLTTIWEVDKIK